jgi:hypothetical protein
MVRSLEKPEPALGRAALALDVLVGAKLSRTERQQRRRGKPREIVHADQVLADLERAYSRASLPEQFAIRSGVKKLLERWQNGEADRDPTWRQIMRERAKETPLSRR